MLFMTENMWQHEHLHKDARGTCKNIEQFRMIITKMNIRHFSCSFKYLTKVKTSIESQSKRIHTCMHILKPPLTGIHSPATKI